MRRNKCTAAKERFTVKKCLIHLRVPSIRREYDVWMPQDVQIRTVCQVLADGIREMSEGLYCCSDKEMLIKPENEWLLNPEKCLMDYDIADGDELILL